MRRIASAVLAVVALWVTCVMTAVPAYAATPVAKIGDTPYDTLQAAMDAAKDGDVVTLTADTAENVVVPAKKLTLDLHGNTLSGGQVPKKAALLNEGVLTVKDSSDAATGCIKREDTATSTGWYYVIDNQGTMTFESGNVRNDSGDGTERGSSLIRNAGEGKQATLTIAGGQFVQERFIVVKNDDLGVLTVTGGTLTTGKPAGNRTYSAVQNWASATISGGTLNGALWTGSWSAKYDAPQTVVEGNAVVNGSVVVKQETTDGKPDATLPNPQLEVQGGTMNVPAWDVMSGAAEVEISGGTFTGVQPQKDWIDPGCGFIENEDGSLVAHHHQMKAVAETDSTCVKQGQRAHYWCPVEGCGKLFADQDGRVELSREDVAKPLAPHALTHVVAQQPTETADGHVEHWVCGVCNALFLDADATKPTTAADVRLPAIGVPEVVKHTVTFVCGNGDEMVVEVVDGKAVERPKDPSYDGWTFAGWFATRNADGTLADAYDFATPVTADMTLYGGWVKRDVTPAPSDDVEEAKPEVPQGNEGKVLPQTGDDSLMPMVLAGTVGVAAVVVGVLVARKRG